MADQLDRLAKKLADMYRDNRQRPSTAPRIAKVIGTSPLRIQWGDSVILEADKLVVPRLYTVGHQIPYSGGTITFKIDLLPGDEVMVAPDESLNTWYVIEKL